MKKNLLLCGLVLAVMLAASVGLMVTGQKMMAQEKADAYTALLDDSPARPVIRKRPAPPRRRR